VREVELPLELSSLSSFAPAAPGLLKGDAKDYIYIYIYIYTCNIVCVRLCVCICNHIKTHTDTPVLTPYPGAQWKQHPCTYMYILYIYIYTHIYIVTIKKNFLMTFDRGPQAAMRIGSAVKKRSIVVGSAVKKRSKVV
jgi:hypothetical protein